MNNNRHHPLFHYLLSHLRSLLFGLGELIRSPVATLLTLAVIGIAVALPSGFYLILKNFESISHQWDGQPSISVYLTPELNQSAVQDTQKAIKTIQGIDKVNYISPNEGLAEFAKLTKLTGILGNIKNNPLPAVFVIQPDSDHQSPAQIKLLASELKNLPNVKQVQLDLAWLNRLYSIITIVRRLVIALGILFAVGVVLITGNTIRLIMQNHAREMAIMRLLGATYAFIRRPFLYRGFWYGFFGGLIAWILVSLMLWWLQGPTLDLLSSYGANYQVLGLSIGTGFTIILISSVLSTLGSYIAVKHHLSLDETI